jgi:hypothetical protein
MAFRQMVTAFSRKVRGTNTPIETPKVGSLGTHKMLSLETTRVRLILASASEVYGNPLVNPQPESD